MSITLKAARINVGLNQEDAAKKIGVHESTLRNWEKGKCFPDAVQIGKIEEIYKIQFSDIIFLINNSK